MVGLHIGSVHEMALGCVDDVAAVSSSLDDLPLIDTTVADFEAVSGPGPCSTEIASLW
jgi:hypothetical protein